jgi:DNA-binding MarR family transcriptional regulator
MIIVDNYNCYVHDVSMMSTKTAGIREFRRALRYLERFISSNVKENSVCCGVSPTQCHILLKVEEDKELSPSEIREYIGLDKSSLSRTLDGLVRLGLVERGESSQDRRYQSIHLTERGRKFVERLNDECDKYYEPIFETLSDEVKERLLEDFKLLFEAFSRVRKSTSERRCCSVEDVIEEKEGSEDE